MAKGINDLTLQQQRFVEAYINNPVASDAAVYAGFGVKNSRQIGWQLLQKKHITDAIRAEQQRKLQKLSCLALGTLEQALTDEEVPMRIKIDAAKIVLDRSGYSVDEARASRQTDDLLLEEMTIEQLHAFINEGRRQLGLIDDSDVVEGEIVDD